MEVADGSGDSLLGAADEIGPQRSGRRSDPSLGQTYRRSSMVVSFALGAMAVNGKSFLDSRQQLFVVLDSQVGMNPALHQDSGTA